MNRIDRLFGILTLIQSRKFVPIEKICDKFKISKRTVFRDIKAIGEQGVPIGFEQGKGYFVVHGYYLPPVSFTTEEANAMLLMEAVVKGFADKSIQKHYATAMEKLKAGMGEKQKEKLEHLSDRIHMQVPDCFVMDVEHLSVLQNAISSKHIIALEYLNNKQELSTREVEPLGLVFYALRWHLIAWCHLRKDYRDFKVITIRTMRNTGKPFTKTDHLPLTTFLEGLPVNF